MNVERQVVFWLAAAILFTLGVLLLQNVLLPFVAGLVVAYALNPIVERLSRTGLPRPLVSAVVVLLLVFVLALAIVFLVPMIVSQAQQAHATLPDEVARITTHLETWARERLGERFEGLQKGIEKRLSELSSSWSGLAGTLARSLWDQGIAVVNFLALLLVTPVVIFYMLADWPAIVAAVDRWLPRDHAATIRRVTGEVDSAIAAFIRGQGLVCIILAILYAIGLTWAGLRYGLLIGAATGVLSFVPFVGWTTGLLTAAAFALIEHWPSYGVLLKVLAVFAVGQALDAGVLTPRIVGPKIGLHPVWLIFALFVFSYLFGFVGTLVAVPLAAAIAVLVRFALEVYLSSAIYRGTSHSGAAAQSAPETEHRVPHATEPGAVPR